MAKGSLIGDAAWVVRLGFRASPLFSIISTVLLLIASVIPALNVAVVKAIANNMSQAGSPVGLVIACGVVFGFGNAFVQAANSISRINAIRINVYSAGLFDARLAQTLPSRFEVPDFMRSVRNALSSVVQGYPSSQFQATVNIACALVTAVSLALALWGYSPRAAIVSLFAPVPTAIAFGWYGKQESRFWPVSSEHDRRATYLEDQLAYANPGFELALIKSLPTFRDLARESRRAFQRVRLTLEGKSILSDSIAGIATTVLFCLALTFLYIDSVAVSGSLFAGLVGLMSGVSAMAGVGYQIGELLSSMPANRYLRTFLDMEEKPQLSVTGSACTDTEQAQLAVRDLTVRYGHTTAVDSVSFTINFGQMVAIVGENGSGKTSLLKALMNVQPDASGMVRIGGATIDLSADSQLTYPFAVLKQDFSRYEVTVREFVSLGVDISQRSDEKIWNALAVAEADGFVSRLDNGLDTLLGTQWGGVELSGGQWQRLAIARVVLSDLPLWYLDEPTSAIDALAEESIINRLADEAKRRIVVVTSHRVAALRSVDYIYVLKAGRIVESGTFDQLLAGQTEFRRMFAAQLDVSGS
ncbi:MAG: ABC transporter ATP-binding protein [Actinomycetaceae bacterium]|nr:ABC transporter ATP-binding protein [Actinomycetaceae bacterium]MDY6082354.1 ABC transporter ATP-binding protein [Actinomycetaceae bacterium]